jgi:P63C domain
MSDPDITGKAKGGFARAKVLSPEERKEIGRKAAAARWGADLPRASHEGEANIGGVIIPAANLPDGRRVLSQGRFLQIIGRSRSPKSGTGALATVDGLPFFLQAEVLKPFISKELAVSTAPVFYLTKSGKKAVGYDALMLPDVVNVYLDFRTARLADGKSIPAQYAHIIVACDALSRGLQRLGIIGLVDEATGYQEVRDKQALQAILDQFLRKELAVYAKRFPDEFYEHIFRLRNWQWKGRGKNPPQAVAAYTKDIVYARLAPGILEELEKKNPSESGSRKAKHHQWLTDDVGHPALTQHLYAVIRVMRGSSTWDEFKMFLDKFHPKRGDTLQLPLMMDVSYPPKSIETLPLFGQSHVSSQE